MLRTILQNHLLLKANKKSVYENANLSIFVNESCNADCRFCVDQLRFEGKGKTFIKERIADDEEYFTRLEEVLSTLRPSQPVNIHHWWGAN